LGRTSEKLLLAKNRKEDDSEEKRIKEEAMGQNCHGRFKSRAMVG